MTLCDGEEETREAVIRGKAQGNPAATVLHSLLRCHTDNLQLYAARVLRACAEDSTVRVSTHLLRAWLLEHVSFAAFSRPRAHTLHSCTHG